MSSVFSSIFSNEEIQYLLQLPEVVSAKDRFGSSDKVQFTIALTDGIRTALQTRFGLDLSSVSEIPMRWIKGDTAAHVDRGSRTFENTYLVYLQDSEGEFILGTDSYPITANTGFVFSEGTMHKTLNTGTEPRLLIGPMNEFAGPVGTPTKIYYYTDYYSAFNESAGNMMTSQTTYILATVNSITNWRIAKIINEVGTNVTNVGTNPGAQYVSGNNLGSLVGTGDPNDGGSGNVGGYWVYHLYRSFKIVYYIDPGAAALRGVSNAIANGDSYTLGDSLLNGASITPYVYWSIAFVTNNSAPTDVYANSTNIASATSAVITDETTQMYYVYNTVVCFLEGTQILCLKDDVETYLPIETMRTGLLVKTSCDGYKKVELIGKSTIQNSGTNARTANRLYKLTPSEYPDLKENLFITGGHSVLVDEITDKEREGVIKHIGDIFVTDKKYRLTALVDERAKPWASEGTYTIWHFALEHEDIKMNYGIYANGLLVESCSINTMQTKANLSLV